jgi:hypothetical protein
MERVELVADQRPQSSSSMTPSPVPKPASSTFSSTTMRSEAAPLLKTRPHSGFGPRGLGV